MLHDGVIKIILYDLVVWDAVPLAELQVCVKIISVRKTLPMKLSSHVHNIRRKSFIVESVKLLGCSFKSCAADLYSANKLHQILKVKTSLTACNKNWVFKRIS